jgi:hypothetical protein
LRKRKKCSQADSTLWTDDAYKRLRVQALEADIHLKELKRIQMEKDEDRKADEFEARMELLKAQTQESKIKSQLMKAELKLKELQIKNFYMNEN